MKPLKFSLLALATTLAAGCATAPSGLDDKTVGAATGAVVGCVGGAVLARITGQNVAAGCVAGGAVGGLIGFERARQQEIAAATQAQQQAVAALQQSPAGRSVRAGEVKTVEVTATDKTTKQASKYQAFDSVSVEIPLSAKGTPEYDQAIGKLKALAEKVADERGSSTIEIAMKPADMRARKVVQETATVNTAQGHPITVSKTADSSLPKGVERFTVRAGALKQTEV